MKHRFLPIVIAAVMMVSLIPNLTFASTDTELIEIIQFEFSCYLPIVTATIEKDNKAHLSWNKFNAADGYEVYCTNDEGKFELLDTVTTNSCVENVYSQYRVRGYRMVKGEKIDGRFSEPVEATKPEEKKPEKFTQKTKITKIKSKKKGTITLTFKAIAGVKKYQVSYKVGRITKTLNTKKTTLTIKKLKSKKKYSVRVSGIMYYGKVMQIGPSSPVKKVKVK